MSDIFLTVGMFMDLRIIRRQPLRVAMSLGVSLSLSIASSVVLADKSDWQQSGQDIKNQRHQAKEKKIGVDNVGELVPIWETDLLALGGGDVYTTPAVQGEHVYFPDSAGYLYKLDRHTGELVWQKKVSEYSSKPPTANVFARTTPAIKGNTLIIGDQANRFPFYNGFDISQAVGAEVMAVNKDTGESLWTTVVDDHPFSIITAAATIYKNIVLVGVSSYESAYAAYLGSGLIPFDYSPDSNGSLVALDLASGEIIWQRFMTTEEFSGASIWGSAPSIDEERGQVFVGTGQNFDMPPEVQTCAQEAYEMHPLDPAAGAEEARSCLDAYPDNHFDSILALDIETGEINWSNRVVGYDVWHAACLFGLPICPNPTGSDADFGQAPIYFSIGKGDTERDVIGVGQKSGRYWVFDAVDGELIWNTQVSPGGIAGGIQWGSAYDGERIYTSSANSDSVSYQLPDGSTVSGGIWSALNPETGEILWQTGDPNNSKSGGAASVANGVVYVCAWDPSGHMYALNATTGDILWSFPSGGSCNSGAAISKGKVFWGSGYASSFDPTATPAQYFRAFGLPD